jgi:hypothetical protein
MARVDKKQASERSVAKSDPSKQETDKLGQSLAGQTAGEKATRSEAEKFACQANLNPDDFE